MRSSLCAGAAMVLLAAVASAQQQQGGAANNAAKIASAISAAPADIASGATVAEVGPDGKMITLRKGTNGWLCMADNPTSPGHDPICADKQWQQWLGAWMSKKNPNVKQMGIAYMLQGGSDASNTDPFLETPADGKSWVNTPAHIMILLPDPKQLESYPGTVGKGAFIMFPGTPYAHLMLPVPK